MAASGYKVFTTGDVLTAADVNNYLMLQTVMVFANAAARTTALSSVLAAGLVSYLKDTNVVEIYTGSGWVSLDDPNAVQNASYYAAGKNGVINAAMNNWQRGTSFTATGYTADRWYFYNGVAGRTVSRQTSALTGFQYCMRVQRDSGNTNTTDLLLTQSMDTATSLQFANQTVTVSFWARAGANYSAASNALAFVLLAGTGTDQNYWTAYTGTTVPFSGTATLTTSWQRFTFTGTVASTVTELTPYWKHTPVGTAGTNDYYEITGVQLEIGATATAFQTASGTIGGELALCQRYYWRASAESKAYNVYSTLGIASSAAAARFAIANPVAMRTAATTVDYSNISLWDSGAYFTITSLAFNAAIGNTQISYIESAGSTLLTIYRPYFLAANNSTAAYLGFSAEL